MRVSKSPATLFLVALLIACVSSKTTTFQRKVNIPADSNTSSKPVHASYSVDRHEFVYNNRILTKPRKISQTLDTQHQFTSTSAKHSMKHLTAAGLAGNEGVEGAGHGKRKATKVASPFLFKLEYEAEVEQEDPSNNNETISKAPTEDEIMEFLEKVYQGMEIAGKILSNQLQIYNQIVVVGVVAPLGKNESEGRATASGLWDAKTLDYDRFLLYNQALVKQLNHSGESLSYYEDDVILVINYDRKFYFPIVAKNETSEDDDYDDIVRKASNKIQPDEIDFVLFACHQLLIGFGFDAGWTTIDKDVDIGKNKHEGLEILIPPRALDETGIPREWFALTAFDKFLVVDETKENFFQYVDRISKFNLESVDENWIDEFIVSGDPYEASKEMHKAATSQTSSVVFYNPDTNETFPLYKPPKFDATKSMCLLDESLQYTSDYLTSYKNGSWMGERFSDVALKYSNSTKRVLGTNTLKILHTLGWPTKYNDTQQVIQFNWASEDKESSGAIGVDNFFYIVSLFISLLLV